MTHKIQVVQRGKVSTPLTRTISAVDSGAQDIYTLTGAPCSEFTVQAKATGWTAWNLLLEGSLDGTNWDTLGTATQTNDGKLVFVTAKRVGYARLNLTAASGGSSGQHLTVSVLAGQ